MNTSDLCKAIARESGVGITKEQAWRILATIWRVMLEELFVDPDSSQVMLTGIGKFYMKRRRFNVPVRREDNAFKKGKTELKAFWVLKFQPSVPLKDVMRNRKDMRELELGYRPIYFDKDEKKLPRQAFKEGEKQLEKMRRKDTIRKSRQDYIDNMNRIEKINLEQRLPED